MALKNPNLYPQWAVYVWKERPLPGDEWETDCFRADTFDNEEEAYALYQSIDLTGNIVEVDLEKDMEYDWAPVRHKDTSGEYIY